MEESENAGFNGRGQSHLHALRWYKLKTGQSMQRRFSDGRQNPWLSGLSQAVGRVGSDDDKDAGCTQDEEAIGGRDGEESEGTSHARGDEGPKGQSSRWD